VKSGEAKALAVPVEPQNTSHLRYAVSIGNKPVEIFYFHQNEYVEFGFLRRLYRSNWNVAALRGNAAFRTYYIRDLCVNPSCHGKWIKDFLQLWRINAGIPKGYPSRRHVTGIFDINADTPHGWFVRWIGDNSGIKEIHKGAVS